MKEAKFGLCKIGDIRNDVFHPMIPSGGQCHSWRCELGCFSQTAPIISERGKTSKRVKNGCWAAFWEERREGAAATMGKFANDLGKRP